MKKFGAHLKNFGIKGLALFSVLRLYNITLIILAQYLCSIFILAPDTPIKELLLDKNLALLILATALVIASGYLINNFYDSEKDLINKPLKSMLDRHISQRAKINAYFVFNFLAVLVAAYVSFRAALFFSVYIFWIWLYSHKLKKMLWIGNIIASILSIMPFFPVFVHYKNFHLVIFVHALYLFTLIFIREILKDLENIAGDLSNNYKTIPVRYGPNLAKHIIFILVLCSWVPSTILITYFDIGFMYAYFIGSNVILIGMVLLLYLSKTKVQYRLIHLLLKGLLVVGVFSISLIDVDLFISRLF